MARLVNYAPKIYAQFKSFGRFHTEQTLLRTLKGEAGEEAANRFIGQRIENRVRLLACFNDKQQSFNEALEQLKIDETNLASYHYRDLPELLL